MIISFPNGKCKICNEDLKSESSLFVEYDQETKEVRGSHVDCHKQRVRYWERRTLALRETVQDVLSTNSIQAAHAFAENAIGVDDMNSKLRG